MGITLKQAYERAVDAIADEHHITFAREGSVHWFFGVGDAIVDSVSGGSPIAIDKKTGEVSYPIPSIPSVVLGKQPTSVEIEIAKALDVTLPI